MKIPSDKRRRLYELTVLTPADFTSAEVKKTQEELITLLGKYHGDVEKTDEWGQKDLAYAIRYQGKPQTRANYTQYLVKLDPAFAQNLEKELGLNNTVMRHLLVIAQTKDSSTQFAAKPAAKPTTIRDGDKTTKASKTDKAAKS